MTNQLRTFRVSEVGLLSADERRREAVRVPADFPFEQMLAVRGTDLLDSNQKELNPFRYVDGRTMAGEGHVGVVETAGTVVELLPKTWSPEADPSTGRAVLEAMLESYVEQGRLSPRRSARRLLRTRLQASPQPVGERIFQRFTDEAEAVLQARVRFGYSPVEEQRPFLRGRLNLGRQLRQPPGRDHLFHIRHARFHPDRPENRLLKSALRRVAVRSTNLVLRTRAAQLAEFMLEVPTSREVRRDLAQWDRGRLLAHYAAVQPWCQLVMEPMVGLTAGTRFGEAWLWRTDRMFERHVEMRMRARLEAAADLDLELVVQGEGEDDRGRRGWHLGLDAEGKGVFRLQPDLAIREGSTFRAVLDAKWKTKKETRETEGQSAARTPVTREDAYQMYAYGHRFLKGSGPLVLVYPSTSDFLKPVRHELGDLRLVAVPFDVVADRFLVGDDPKDIAALGEELHRLLALDPSADVDNVEPPTHSFPRADR